MLKRRAQEADSAADETAARSGQVTDRVTGLPNRSQLAPLLRQLLEHGRSTSERTGLLFIEIGHLRDVNDTYGPDIGDRLLQGIAARIGNELGGGQRLLRWSGAELALVAPGVQTADTAENLAQGIFQLLAEPFDIDQTQVVVSASIGASLSADAFASVEQWIEDAHDAMIEARQLGNRATVSRDEATRNRMDIKITEDSIFKAVENQEFRLLYQPIVVIGTGTIVGFEALLRWLDPTASAKFVPPSAFLPILEKTGHIIKVGEWVINEAVRQCKDWNGRVTADRDPFFVSVNLGARQMAETRFSDTVTNALEKSGLPPELLTLDITPEALKYNRQATWGELRDLKYSGVRLALDDFGVGESTISYLREIQVDLLRLHGTFISGLGTTPEDEAIVKHLVGLGLDLGILSLAEQVESQTQAAKLRELGCALAQGFHYGRPELPADIEAQHL